jgi:hypothetical protein
MGQGNKRLGSSYLAVSFRTTEMRGERCQCQDFQDALATTLALFLQRSYDVGVGSGSLELSIFAYRKGCKKFGKYLMINLSSHCLISETENEVIGRSYGSGRWNTFHVESPSTPNKSCKIR